MILCCKRGPCWFEEKYRLYLQSEAVKEKSPLKMMALESRETSGTTKKTRIMSNTTVRTESLTQKVKVPSRRQYLPPRLPRVTVQSTIMLTLTPVRPSIALAYTKVCHS